MTIEHSEGLRRALPTLPVLPTLLPNGESLTSSFPDVARLSSLSFENVNPAFFRQAIALSIKFSSTCNFHYSLFLLFTIFIVFIILIHFKCLCLVSLWICSTRVKPELYVET